MALEECLNKKVKVTQVRSACKLTKRQLGTLVGLGLRRIGSSREIQCDQSIRGMLIKLPHIVKVELS